MGELDFLISFVHQPSRKMLSVQSPAGDPASVSRCCRRAVAACALADADSQIVSLLRAQHYLRITDEQAGALRSLRRTGTFLPSKSVGGPNLNPGQRARRPGPEADNALGVSGRIVKNSVD